jgi:hypothetical protein
VSTVVVFFIIGGLILLSVDETEGIAQAVLPEPDQGGESWRAAPE